jgi:hypothetical protein
MVTDTKIEGTAHFLLPSRHKRSTVTLYYYAYLSGIYLKKN